MNGIGMTKNLSLASVVAICSVALGKPVVSSAVELGDFSIGGTVMEVDELANTLQVCLDSGAKKYCCRLFLLWIYEALRLS